MDITVDRNTSEIHKGRQEREGEEATQRSKLNIASAPQFPDWQGKDPEIIFKR